VKKIIVIAFALVLFTTAGYAQIPTKGNIFFGYSYNRADAGSGNTSNLNGWEASFEGKVFPFIGIVADFSGHSGSQSFPIVTGICTGVPGVPCSNFSTVTANANLQNFLFGPRVSFSAGKLRPFAHILVGASHVSASDTGFSTSSTSFAEAVGGGIDYQLIHGIAWRVQADLLQTRFSSNTQNDARISTGLVVNF
jgi:hypothetical protein